MAGHMEGRQSESVNGGGWGQKSPRSTAGGDGNTCLQRPGSRSQYPASLNLSRRGRKTKDLHLVKKKKEEKKLNRGITEEILPVYLAAVGRREE